MSQFLNAITGNTLKFVGVRPWGGDGLARVAFMDEPDFGLQVWANASGHVVSQFRAALTLTWSFRARFDGPPVVHPDLLRRMGVHPR